MLNAKRHTQQGVVLLMALIVLVALTLAALALTRSAYTSTTIAGNIAFQQAATHSADRGIEAAVAWLETNNGQATSPNSSATTCTTGTSVLACNQTSQGYVAIVQSPTSTQTWSQFWKDNVAANNQAVTMSADATTGNQVYYVIHRMCSAALDAQATGNYCSTSPVASSSSCQGGSSCGAQSTNLSTISQVYYRITVRVVGPRNAESYVQSMVAL